MKTALQQAIDLVTQKKHHRGPLYRAAMEDAIDILTELLPTEREIIEGAYNAGSDDKFYCVTGELGLVKYDDKADYYNQTFNQTDKNETDAN